MNLFSANAPLLYPLKTSENRRFSDVFRGYRSGTLVENGSTSHWSLSDVSCFQEGIERTVGSNESISPRNIALADCKDFANAVFDLDFACSVFDSDLVSLVSWYCIKYGQCFYTFWRIKQLTLFWKKIPALVELVAWHIEIEVQLSLFARLILVLFSIYLNNW